MIIKKYQAKTETDAVEQAKKELGSGVVIMNVRNVKKKGLFALFGSKQVEVTVALEDDTEKVAQRREPLKSQAATLLTEPVKREPASAANREILPESADNAGNGKVIEEKLDSLQNFLAEKLREPEEEKEKKEADEEEGKDSESVVFMKLLYNTMLENEVNEKYANQIIDEIEKSSNTNLPMDQALAGIYQKMILKFGKPVTITPAERGPKMLFFVGPTGVGKTTTIAKLASQFRVEEKKKVALLTADTYRIAAVEQLRTYANILDVPFRVIYSAEEVLTSLHDLQDYDYIMVDTAGHSHHNEVQRENMNQFIHSVDGKVEKEVFLVVSATTKYRDLINIAETYMDMTDYRLIFTKLDETTALGNLLNLKLYTGAALSYVTYGQNVPDDIEKFNPQKTVKLLLGGKKQ